MEKNKNKEVTVLARRASTAISIVIFLLSLGCTLCRGLGSSCCEGGKNALLGTVPVGL